MNSSYGKHYRQTAGVDYMGLSFDYPEEKITGMKWLGCGPTGYGRTG